MTQMDLSTEQKQTHRLKRTSPGWSGEKDEGKGELGKFGMDRYTPPHLKRTPTKTSCTAQHAAQCYAAARMGGEFRGEWIHV